LDQERKLALSGLRDMFDSIEIVSDKTPATYRRIFSQHGDGVERGMMVGNSMKSDVVPMVDAGGWGIHVPHGITWALEHADTPDHSPRFRQIADLSELEQILD
jgi:putative hydrolase of the HAD superfamily